MEERYEDKGKAQKEQHLRNWRDKGLWNKEVNKKMRKRKVAKLLGEHQTQVAPTIEKKERK